jgi:hypothetical protein
MTSGGKNPPKTAGGTDDPGDRADPLSWSQLRNPREDATGAKAEEEGHYHE